jgi:hypothetical protein
VRAIEAEGENGWTSPSRKFNLTCEDQHHRILFDNLYNTSYYDGLHIYTTNEVIRKSAAEDDLTSQYFINNSIVLVNGNRVDISDTIQVACVIIACTQPTTMVCL